MSETDESTEEIDAVKQNFTRRARDLINHEQVSTVSPHELRTPPDSIDDMAEWVSDYLAEGNRAHQFTINHLTFPLVRDLHFAAFPLPPHISQGGGNETQSALGRQFEIFAAAKCIDPGDLIFFYKSDMKQEGEGYGEGDRFDSYQNDLERSRGIVGLYRATSDPFVDPTSISHRDTDERDTEYRISGACSHEDCGCVYSWPKGHDVDSPIEGSDVDDCWCPGTSIYGNSDPTLDHRNENTDAGSLTLAGRIDLEPITVFRLPVPDNTVYGVDQEPIIWSGRFDNAMGAGKGSTVRHLLPEEAERLTHLLVQLSSDLEGTFADDYSPIRETDKEPYRGRTGALPMVYHMGVPTSLLWVEKEILEDLPEVGDAIADNIRESDFDFETVDDLRNRDPEQLIEEFKRIDNLGPKTAPQIIDHLRDSPSWEIKQENIIFLEMARQIDQPDSSLLGVLSDILDSRPNDLVSQLEYCSWEFPWGFANDQCDFVARFRNDGEMKVVLFENKRGTVSSQTPVVQLMLYVPWITRALTRFAQPQPTSVSVTPLLVGREQQDLTMAEGYEWEFSTPAGSTTDVVVNDSEFISYDADESGFLQVDGATFADGLRFDRETDISRFEWDEDYHILSATKAEKAFLEESWTRMFRG